MILVINVRTCFNQTSLMRARCQERGWTLQRAAFTTTSSFPSSTSFSLPSSLSVSFDPKVTTKFSSSSLVSSSSASLSSSSSESFHSFSSVLIFSSYSPSFFDGEFLNQFHLHFRVSSSSLRRSVEEERPYCKVIRSQS